MRKTAPKVDNESAGRKAPSSPGARQGRAATIDLDAIDFKLLSVFEAVMAEASISRAARRLGMAQSAVSQAIARLRPILRDELFERTGRGVKPTPRACELDSPVRQALALLRSSFNPSAGFDPATNERTFFVAMPPGLAEAFAEQLLEVIPVSSRVRLYVVMRRRLELEADLRFGEPELAVVGEPIEAHGFRNELLFTDEVVVMTRPGHPATTTPLNWDTYSRLQHAVLSRSGPTEQSPIDMEFARRGAQRRVPIALPSAAAVLRVVARSDLVCTLGRRLAEAYAPQYDLEIHELPVDQPQLPLFLTWHDRFDNDRGHQWLRRALRDILRA